MKSLLSRPEKRRYRRRLRIKLYVYGGLFSALAVLAAYGVVNAEFFKIKSFQISGIVQIEEIRPEVFSDWKARILGLNHFLSWPDEAGGVKIEKDYFGKTLTLTGKDAGKFAVWCTGADYHRTPCFWVSEDGIASAEAPDTDGSAIAKIEDSRNFLPAIGKEVLEKEKFAAVSAIVKGVAELPITISRYAYEDRMEELRAWPVKGAELIFSVRFLPSDKLFGSLLNLIKSGQIRGAEYADFTVENRIYLR